MLNDKCMIFRLVVLHLPHTSYAYKNYWLCYRCDRDSMLKKSAAINDVKRSHHLSTHLMLVGVQLNRDSVYKDDNGLQCN